MTPLRYAVLAYLHVSALIGAVLVASFAPLGGSWRSFSIGASVALGLLLVERGIVRGLSCTRALRDRFCNLPPSDGPATWAELVHLDALYVLATHGSGTVVRFDHLVEVAVVRVPWAGFYLDDEGDHAVTYVLRASDGAWCALDAREAIPVLPYLRALPGFVDEGTAPRGLTRTLYRA